jgi:hypothetical protein
VLGAELSVLKVTAVALSEQLKQLGAAADQCASSQPQQQPTSEFSFRPLQAVAGQASISLDATNLPAEGQQQVRLPGHSAGGDAAAGDRTAAATAGAVSVSPAVLQQLQSAAQQQQRRCAKWKARCKQLAQQLTLLTAQWVAGQAQAVAGAATDAAAAAAAGTTDGTAAQQEQQQAAAAAAGAGEVGAAEAASAQEVAAAVAAAAGMAALLSRLEEFESQLDSRLQQSLGAAGALLTRGEGLAQDASAAANALEVRVQPLLGCAAGLEAQVAVLEQRLADAQARHEAAVAEQAGALEGASVFGGPGSCGRCCFCVQPEDHMCRDPATVLRVRWRVHVWLVIAACPILSVCVSAQSATHTHPLPGCPRVPLQVLPSCRPSWTSCSASCVTHQLHSRPSTAPCQRP